VSSQDTTVPPVTTSSAASSHRQVPVPGVSLAWSAEESWRIGESAPCRPFETESLGRAELCMALERHRPGVRWGDLGGKGGLVGRSISRQQVELIGTAVGIEARPVKGASPTYVNGVELRGPVVLQHGHTAMLKSGALLLCVQRARMMERLPAVFVAPLFGEPDAAGIVGESALIWELRRQLVLAALAGENVLLLGEKGCGKERAAKAIHLWSDRATMPFVTHNAPATTVSLLELELFGRIKGHPQANDPAVVGILTQAEGGTLFVDEIANLPKQVQVALLRPMDPGEYKVMGDPRVRIANVRWVAATNRDPDDRALLEADFVDRWPIQIHIPPLRERPEDIVLLLRHLLLRRAKAKPALGLERFLTAGPDGRLYAKMSGSFAEYLVTHPLPGNMRDLKAILLASIDASPGDMLVKPPEVVPRSAPVPSSAPVSSAPVSSGPSSAAVPETEGTESGERLDPSNREEFLAGWESVGRSVAGMARRYGLSRQSIYRWMDAHGVPRTGGKVG
jgi:DNA-binding NtrC family response regulator